MKRKMKLISLLLVMLFIVGVILPVNVAAKEYSMKDVQKTDDAYQSIQDVLNQGWMSLTLNKFFPEKYITRAEFTLILTKFNGQLAEASKIKKVTFKDTSLKDQYGKYIELQKNYMTYYKTKDGNYFKPKNYISREDALVAMVKALGYDTDDAIAEGSDSEIDINEIIEDSNKISPALKAFVTIGVTNQLIDLREDGDVTYLDPKKSITRRQMAQLLVNAKDAKEINKAETTTDELTDKSESKDTDKTNNKTDIQKNSETKNDDKINDNNNKSDSNTVKDSEKSNELGYLKITINDKEKVYKPVLEGNVDFMAFYIDKYSKNDCFFISLPKDIEIGDTITFDRNSSLSSYSFDGYVKYITSKGSEYFLGIPSNHEDSMATISITKMEGKGGYITGTISGELKLYDGEKVTFKNGEFKFKLKGSEF